ncbi:DUF1992 domain-containing protein [Streptomyces hoynatensis]|uniref:DUF1992 domain-containing protein n=1 Tax=Streptomyces hoynatensis TaxID=1141874 RepID=A0A3A9Z172_9ACTN|nr:DUF1992 domain-containing protein [Streptomyces hoynatensis]RKN41694.1 DUF1992 domain-containing protein [Streptomyces hoynatensis]
MTERKPPGIGFESWIDKQIREAEERGEFRDLPGAGKPLEGGGEPYDELWWVKRKLHQEGVSFLPPTLALRKEAEDVLAAAAVARSEAEVRRMVAEINEKIRAALRRPPEGPPLNLVPFDPERVVADWRAGREPREGSASPDTAR